MSTQVTELTLEFAFKAMRSISKKLNASKPPPREVSHNGVRFRVTKYTTDPNGYTGPEVLVCAPPPTRSEPDPDEEPLHLYYFDPATGTPKKAYIPKGKEGDRYLLDFVIDLLEEMEADGKDGHELSLQDCVQKVDEHLRVQNAEPRLNPILTCAQKKLTATKLDGLEWEQENLVKEIEATRKEMQDNVAVGFKRLDHVEDRVDDVEEDVDELKENVGSLNENKNEVNARFERLELAANLEPWEDFKKLTGGSLFDAPRTITDVPANLERYRRAARAKTLTQEEANALKHYTTEEGCAEINGALRAGQNAVARQVRDMTNRIEGGLRKIGPPHVGKVYRGVDMPADWVQDMREKISNRGRGERLNVPFCDAAFLSTSSMLGGAFVDKSCRFSIQSKTGKAIAAYSVHPDEHEVLFPPKTQFTIHAAIELEGGKLFIRMREN